MEELNKVPEVRSNDGTAKLKELCDNVGNNPRGLRALGIKANGYGCILVVILKNKLQTEINLLLNRKFDLENGLWIIEGMLKDLRIKLKVRERCFNRKKFA